MTTIRKTSNLPNYTKMPITVQKSPILLHLMYGSFIMWEMCLDIIGFTLSPAYSKKDRTISSSNGCILQILNGLTILTGLFTADFNGKHRLQFLNTNIWVHQTFLHRECFLPPSFINENVSHMAELLVK